MQFHSFFTDLIAAMPGTFADALSFNENFKACVNCTAIIPAEVDNIIRRVGQ